MPPMLHVFVRQSILGLGFVTDLCFHDFCQVELERLGPSVSSMIPFGFVRDLFFHDFRVEILR